MCVLGLHSGPQIVLHCPPNIFNRVQVQAGGWCFPKVDVVVLKVVMGPSAGVLGAIILLEMMMSSSASKMSVYLVVVRIPVKLTTAVAPLADIPAHTCTFGQGRRTLEVVGCGHGNRWSKL